MSDIGQVLAQAFSGGAGQLLANNQFEQQQQARTQNMVNQGMLSRLFSQKKDKQNNGGGLTSIMKEFIVLNGIKPKGPGLNGFRDAIIESGKQAEFQKFLDERGGNPLHAALARIISNGNGLGGGKVDPKDPSQMQ